MLGLLLFWITTEYVYIIAAVLITVCFLVQLLFCLKVRKPILKLIPVYGFLLAGLLIFLVYLGLFGKTFGDGMFNTCDFLALVLICELGIALIGNILAWVIWGAILGITKIRIRKDKLSMKKLPLLLLLTVFIISLASCHDGENAIPPKGSSAENGSFEEPISEATQGTLATEDTGDVEKQDYNAIRLSLMILPEDVEVINTSAEEWFQIFMKYGFTAYDIIGGKVYGEDGDPSADKYFPALFDVAADEVKRIVEPSEIADTHWVGTNAKVVLNNRYLYDCRNYGNEGEKFEVLLRRTDLENGVVEIIDTVIQDTPFINLCKLDENCFLSYTSVTLDDESVLSEVYKYSEDGEKSLFISEKYISNPTGNDEGILLEHLIMWDGKLCGIGRRHVDGRTRFCIYTYDTDGNFIEMSEIKDLDELIGETSVYDVAACGNYIVFRAYDSLTAYICEISDSGARIIAKGKGLTIGFAISKDCIFYAENYTALENGSLRLYVLNTATGETKAVDFALPLEKAYLYSIASLSDGGIMLQLCEGEHFDVLNVCHYVLTAETAEALLEECGFTAANNAVVKAD